ncbi:MAG TPA: M50 family metallopeptidase, partial [Archangium sp.]
MIAAGVFFWDSPVLLPFKLLSVMGHETGHALASLLVGGSVDRVSLRLDQSGECLSSTPDGFVPRVIVYSAGYVGSAIIAVLLLVLTFRFEARRLMLALACAWLSLMALFYARDAFTLVFALVMAGL